MKNIINRINNMPDINVPSYYLIGDYNTYYADQILRNVYMMDLDEEGGMTPHLLNTLK